MNTLELDDYPWEYYDQIQSGNFCWWCGYANRDSKGHCLVCYPPGHPWYSGDMFYAHVLFVRNKKYDSHLNNIPERIKPVDYIRRYTDSISDSSSIDNIANALCNMDNTQHDRISPERHIGNRSKKIQRLKRIMDHYDGEK